MLKQKEKMIVIDKTLRITKNNIPIRFIFEFGKYISSCYDLYGNYPKYSFGFCFALVYTPRGKVKKYIFGKNYLGILL